jgi:hypothetical protein
MNRQLRQAPQLLEYTKQLHVRFRRQASYHNSYLALKKKGTCKKNEKNVNKKFLEVRTNETFFQKGFWPPEAKLTVNCGALRLLNCKTISFKIPFYIYI